MYENEREKNYYLCKDILNMSVAFQLHAGIAEVAAAKARMFVNKPDGSMFFEC